MLSDPKHRLYADIDRDTKIIRYKLDELIRLAEKSNVSAKHHMCYGQSKEEIFRFINKQDIDLVVMGSHGARGIKELFVSSNAQQVARYSDAPVLILKKKIDTIISSHVIYISEFNQDVLTAFEKVL